MTTPEYARGYEEFGGVATEFASTSTPWWKPLVTAPAGAPNVIVMLVDDLGFSDLEPFGSEIPTPHISALANQGWTFTNYRTAPMCSPARSALLTGINPHRAGFGYVAHTDPGYPGFASEIPPDAPTLAESLRAGGYATLMVGKWHLTLESRLHDGADKSSWPLQRGFDRYFGCMDGFTSLYHPHRLVRDNSVVPVAEFADDYYLTDELTSEATAMIDQLRSSDAQKPFFLYYAHTSVHGPVQAKPENIKPWEGKYQQGWNTLREARFAKQKELGIIPEGTVLPPDEIADGSRIPRWETLSDDDQALFARHMEVYAAAVTEIDHSVGQLVTYLESIGERENTIIILTSDNGGTAEGGPTGTRSYFAQFAQVAGLPQDWVRDVPRPLEEIGGPSVWGHYPTGWARVSNTPFRSFKSSGYEGGVHAPLVMSWPAAPQQAPGLRNQFVFVSDLAPTVLAMTGVAPLTSRAGRAALEMDGSSVAKVLHDAGAPGRERQYFECVGNRALVDGDWKIVSSEVPTAAEGADGGRWELFHLPADASESQNLAGQYPERTAALAKQWQREAWRNSVFPLDDDGSMHLVRPASEDRLSDPVTLKPFGPPLERYRSAKLTVLRSFSVKCDVDLTQNSRGVIFAHGDQGGGYLLTVADGDLVLSYNAYGQMHRERVKIPGFGRQVLKFRVLTHDNFRCTVTLESDDSNSGVGGQNHRVIAMIPAVPMLMGMAPFTGISVGYDYGSPVDWELYAKHRSNRFQDGTIHSVRYVPGARSELDRTVVARIDEAVAVFAD